MNSKYNNNHFELITTLFCMIDDFMKLSPKKKLGTRVGRKPSLSGSEVITIVIFGKLLGYKTLSGIYWHMRNYFSKCFSLPHYKNFVTLSNKHSLEAVEILSILLKMNTSKVKQCLYLIDSSKVAVCGNKRIFKHKVAKGFAQRGMSSMGWFYGFKLHIITDVDGNILRVKITPGNVDDRSPVKDLVKGLSGVLVGDAGYLSKDLQKQLKNIGLSLVTGVRKSMKQLMTKAQHNILKARQMVETSFGVLKGSNDLVSSLARSVDGHFARIVYALLSYSIAKSFLQNNLIPSSK